MAYWPLTFFHVSSDLLLPSSHRSWRVPPARLEISLPERESVTSIPRGVIRCHSYFGRHRGNSAPISRRGTKAPDSLRVMASGGCALRRSSGDLFTSCTVKKTCRPIETWLGHENAIICKDNTELSPPYLAICYLYESTREARRE